MLPPFALAGRTTSFTLLIDAPHAPPAGQATLLSKMSKRVLSASVTVTVAPGFVSTPDCAMQSPGGVFQRMDLRASLAAITCPTLVLAGREDPVIPWELSEELAASLVSTSTPPAQRFVCMDGCGHGIWRDRPEPALALIRAFIDGERD